MERTRGLQVRIVEFREEFAPAFEALNRAWIERYFALEPADVETFRDPGRKIVGAGGQILFAVVDDRPVATCALIPHQPGVYELAKMAVAEDLRGQGIGNRLMTAAIGWAQRTGAERLFLVTNSALTPALRLYEKHGFRREPLDPGGEYARADVQMALTLPRLH